MGLGLAYLHVLGPFLSMYLLWLVETNHKARFVTTDWFHWVIDLVTSPPNPNPNPNPNLTLTLPLTLSLTLTLTQS